MGSATERINEIYEQLTTTTQAGIRDIARELDAIRQYLDEQRDGRPVAALPPILRVEKMEEP